MAPAIRVKLSPRQQAPINTLVLYTFAASDPEYRANFEYFLRYGMGGDNVYYVVILQQATFFAHFSECTSGYAHLKSCIVRHRDSVAPATPFKPCFADV